MRPPRRTPSDNLAEELKPAPHVCCKVVHSPDPWWWGQFGRHIRKFERNEILEIWRRFRQEAQILEAWVCNCIPLWRRFHSKQVAARLTRLTPKPSCASSRPPVGFVQRFAPLIFSSYHTTQPSPPGPTVTTWRYGGGGVLVFYHYKMSLPGGLGFPRPPAHQGASGKECLTP